MDAFAGVYLNGFLRESKVSYLFFAGLVISVFNTLTALAGRLIGSQINLLLENFTLPLAVAIMFVLGIKMAIKSFRPKFQEITFELNRRNILMGYASALGINAFLLGIALSAFDTPYPVFIMMFAGIFFISPVSGMLLSRKSKKFLLAARFEFAGGIVLIGASLFYMIKYFELI